MRRSPIAYASAVNDICLIMAVYAMEDSSGHSSSQVHLFYNGCMLKIYDYTDAPCLDEKEKLIINMNAALLTFHSEEEILSFRNTHLNWLLLYDFKLGDRSFTHARMAYNACGDIVSVHSSISDGSLRDLMTIAEYCRGDVMIDLRDAVHPEEKAQMACRYGVKYVLGEKHAGMTTCMYASVPHQEEKEEI